MNLSNLPFNWFDVLVLAVLLIGLQRGRKRGMSLEFITMLNWVCIVVAAGLLYQPVGDWFMTVVPLSKLSAYILSYLATAGAVAGVFQLLKGSIGKRLAGTDTFGKAEYYLGMPAGVVRFFCILIAGLALLNARLYRLDEVKRMEKYQLDNYGSEFFPTLQSCQASVFKTSLLGPHIKKHLSFLLIEPNQPEPKQVRRAERRLP